MDAYLTCPETKKSMWLGKPIRRDNDEVVFYSQNAAQYNHDDLLLNKVLWKFLAEHAHKDLRILFSGEYPDGDYERVSTWDIEAEDYVRDWPPSEC